MIKNSKYIGFVFLFLTGIVLSVSAQQANLDTLTRKFSRYRDFTAQEKIYVHTDRPLYMTGETMWFSIYYTDGTFHQPLDLSKVCYVELLDSDKQPVLQTKVAMQSKGGSGSLFIPATINSGNFILRAYTSWMKNFSVEFYFTTPVTIINPFRTPDYPSASAARKPDAQFFPEGGNLVQGLAAKIGFRVTDESGKGIDFRGALINQHNDTLERFTPVKFGIGHFTLTPVAEQIYRAVIKTKAGKNYLYDLPRVLETGYAISLSKGTTLNITSTQPDANYAYLLVHTRQKVSRLEVVFLRNGNASVTLNSNDFGEGISHITVFDASLRPVCERLYFRKPETKLTVAVVADQSEYDVRRKGTIELEAKNSTGIPARVSVAVYNQDSISVSDPESIAGYFWLSSDLKGEIESPGYYLNSTDSLAKEASDNLMLTHGWTRFTWTNVLGNKPLLSFIPEVNGHLIHATIEDADGKPADFIQTYLSAIGKPIRLNSSRSRMGKALFEMQDFYGPHKIVLQTNLKRDSMNTVRIVNPFSDNFGNALPPPFHLSTKLEKQVTSRAIGMQVQDVYADERNVRITNPVADSSSFFGKANESYLLDAYTRFPVMEEVMREYVPGVLVRKRRNGFHFVVLDDIRGGVLKDDPMILLDGVPLFDADEIMAFDPLKIKKLEVMTRAYYLGPSVLQGIVSYSTYTGDLAGFQLNPKAVQLDYEGLQVNREFYTPVYDDKKLRSSRIPDQRNLIFWAPELKLESGRKQTVSFYTSDLKGRYLVVVKALSEDGSAADATTSFQVRRFDY